MVHLVCVQLVSSSSSRGGSSSSFSLGAQSPRHEPERPHPQAHQREQPAAVECPGVECRACARQQEACPCKHQRGRGCGGRQEEVEGGEEGQRQWGAEEEHEEESGGLENPRAPKQEQVS